MGKCVKILDYFKGNAEPKQLDYGGRLAGEPWSIPSALMSSSISGQRTHQIRGR